MTRDIFTRVAIFACALAIFSAGRPLAAQPITDQQRRLLAERAARVDALRKLAEEIKGLRITSETLVRDFVAEDDRIDTDLRAALRGARESGPARFYSDGSCDLDMEVTIEWVVTTLKELHARHYRGRRVKVTDFEQLTERLERTVIRVTGSGAPRPPVPPVDEPAGPSGATPPELRIPFGWEDVMPQGRLMARRAAEIDATRKLAERVKGLQINSSTYVRDFVAEDDTIETELATTLKGVRHGEPRFEPDQICTVESEVTIEDVVSTLKELHTRRYRGSRVKATDFEQLIERTQTRVLRETGNGVPPAKYVRQDEPYGYGEAPDWAGEVFRAVGRGTAPADKAGTAQGRLLAARAAEADARRNIAEMIEGIRLDAHTPMRDFLAGNDLARQDLETFLLGVRILHTDYDEHGNATVEVEALMQRWWEIFRSHVD